MPKILKNCIACGVDFEVDQSRDKTARACSRVCSGVLAAKKYEASRVVKNCEVCGGAFSVPQCHDERSRCCSRKCSANLPDRKRVTGENHYMWKGGKTMHADGYVYVLEEDHPFQSLQKYVFEHRLKMEEKMRAVVPDHPFLIEISGVKYLRPEIDVHHINHVKTDNGVKNLLACTKSAHRSIHNGGRPMKGESWPEQKDAPKFSAYRLECKCKVCGTSFDIKRSSVARGGGQYCSRACSNTGRSRLKR
jgi:hypothetical protein